MFGLINNNVAYLIVSLLIFPISLRLALFCFTCFLIGRLSFINSGYGDLLRKIVAGAIIAIAVIKLYAESRSHFYPVSVYDYLVLIITVGIIKLYPLKIHSLYQTCWAICLSLPITFTCYLSQLDFRVRNDWGFENPNWLGLYCSMCLPIVLCIAIYQFQQQNSQLSIRRSITNPLFVIPAIIFCLAWLMIVSSGSRSSLYTSLLAIAIVLAIKAKVNFGADRKLKTVLLVSTILATLTFTYRFFIAKFSFLARFIDLANSTNVYRLKLYKCHLELGWQKPWWGWGINHVSAICEQKFRAGYGGVNHAHNFMLQIFVDRGLIVALGCGIILFFYQVMPTIKLLLNSDLSSRTSAMNIGISLSCLSIIVVSLFQSAFYHYPLFPFWLGLLWGCQLNLMNSKERKLS